MAKSNFSQGFFKPRYPEKYVGDVNRIIYRSSWELNFNISLDGNPNVIKWGSECVAIPYVKPTDQKVHKYYPDYFVMYKDVDGFIHKEIIEIKPSTQTALSKRANLYEQLTYAVNIAKWESAKKWCERFGVTFRIITEKELFK
jgi:hypothetical protein